MSECASCDYQEDAEEQEGEWEGWGEESEPGAAESSTARANTSLDSLCVKIHAKLGDSVDDLPLKSHFKAVQTLTLVRDTLLSGARLSAESKARLLCCGISLLKRARHDPHCSETEVANLKTTMTLVFILLVLGESRSDMEENQFDEVADGDAPAGSEKKTVLVRRLREDEQLLAVWNEASVSNSLFSLSGAFASSHAHRLTYAGVGRASLREARYLLADDESFAEFTSLATVFFHSTSTATVHAALLAAQPREHASLAQSKRRRSDGATSNATLLSSIVDAAESESGQQVLRDLVLSFLLPRAAVGSRRCILLTRDASARATREFTELLTVAHETAMRGANWTWGKDESEVNRACALLAGVAVILGKAKDAIRKGDAFGGRVQLPFLDCRRPADGVPVLALVGSSTWVLYRLKRGKPKLTHRKDGFDGLCDLVLDFMQC